MSITVIVADDQALVRSGIRLILEDQNDMTVVGEAADGVDAVELARSLRPDVCLVDIRMPRQDGIEVARRISTMGPRPPRVVIVTTFDTDEYLYGALQAGAAGFMLKDAGPTLLVEAVRAAASGAALISPSLTVRLLEAVALQHRARAADPAAPLSAREIEVARHLARGRTNAETPRPGWVQSTKANAQAGSSTSPATTLTALRRRPSTAGGVVSVTQTKYNTSQ